MNPSGASDLLILARSALLDALEALEEHRSSLILVGAQAIYLRTGNAPVALAESTKDSDLAINPDGLLASPLLEEAMQKAGFIPDPNRSRVGSWLNAHGIPVDLMVPDRLAGRGRRSVDLPPHSARAMRRTVGLEAAIVDNSIERIDALELRDSRAIDVRVAGSGALLIAKLHKLHDRKSSEDRLSDKDAHDIYRLLVSEATDHLAGTIQELSRNPLSSTVTQDALRYLEELFAAGPNALGSHMAGRAELLVGNPEFVSVSAAELSKDLLGLL